MGQAMTDAERAKALREKWQMSFFWQGVTERDLEQLDQAIVAAFASVRRAERTAALEQAAQAARRQKTEFPTQRSQVALNFQCDVIAEEILKLENQP